MKVEGAARPVDHDLCHSLAGGRGMHYPVTTKARAYEKSLGVMRLSDYGMVIWRLRVEARPTLTRIDRSRLERGETLPDALCECFQEPRVHRHLPAGAILRV